MKALAIRRYKAPMDKTFPLEAAAEAVSYVESGHAVGKVVIRVTD
jgi:NADPH:quinone reductase-like Zn-dependent oxidoreductase